MNFFKKVFHFFVIAASSAISVAFFYKASSSNLLYAMISYVFGFVAWSGFEFILHKRILHSKNKNILHDHHEKHHANPDKIEHIFLPAAFYVPFLVVGFSLLLILKNNILLSALSGFYSGYVWHEILHYMIHKNIIQKRTPLLSILYENHIKHHKNSEDSNYGITTIIWDRKVEISN